MDNYKLKKFLRKFEIDDNKVVKLCPKGIKPIISKCDSTKGTIISNFKIDDCNKCNNIKRCKPIKTELFYEIEVDLKYFDIFNIENSSSMYKEDTLERLMRINMENKADKYTKYIDTINEESKDDIEEISYVGILNQGVNLRRKGKYELAKEKYLKAIQMDPKKSVGYFNLGKILYILGDYEASVRSYKVAYELGDLQDVIVNVFEHMGHALIDNKNNNGKYKYVVSDYLKGMKSIANFKPTASAYLMIEYKKICIEYSKKYLGII